MDLIIKNGTRSAAFLIILAVGIGGVLVSVPPSTAVEEPAPIPDFADTIEPFRIPGTTEGTEKHFEIRDSEYLNVTIDSSEEVKLRMESIPEMVTMMIEPVGPASATQITLSGFAPATRYYKFDDNYHNEVVMVTDTLGAYTYIQDLSQPHFVFIQPRRSTKFIVDDVTGGDCATIGTWDATTKTCTLTMDLTETIQIDSNGITLDGNGYTLTGDKTGFGIFLNGRAGVTIQKLVAKQFGTGISVYSSNNNFLLGNNISSNWNGILFYLANGNTLTGNASNSNVYGIGLYSSSDNTFIGNTISFNTRTGFSVEVSSNNTLINNSMSANKYNFVVSGRGDDITQSLDSHFDHNIDTSNTVDGKPIYYMISATDRVFDAPTNAGTFYCISCNNVTIKGLTLTKNVMGVFLWKTQNSKVEDVIVSDNSHGIVLVHSFNNALTSNTTFNNNSGVALYSSNTNNLANNNASADFVGFVLDTSTNNVLTRNIISNHFMGVTVQACTSNLFYNNNFVNNSIPASIYPFGCGINFVSGNVFNLEKPIGGNYWNNYDAPEEGCTDVNNDLFCDAPFVFSGGQDNLPWTKQDGWLLIRPNPASTDLKQFKSDGAAQIPEGGITDESTVVFKTTLSSPIGNDVKLQLELRQFTESFKEVFDPTDGGFLESGFVASASEASITRGGLVDGEYKWRARAVDSTGNESEWREFGTTGNVDFVVRTVIKINVAVILAEPSDVSHDSFPIPLAHRRPCKLAETPASYDSHTRAYFNDLLFCLSDYNLENSYGTVNLQFRIFGKNEGEWFKVVNPLSTYIDDDEDLFVEDAITMVQTADVGFVFSDYDIILVVHAGVSEQEAGDGFLVTQTWVPLEQPLGSPPYKILVSEYSRLGAWAHEIGHVLGQLVLVDDREKTLVPDLYRMGLYGSGAEGLEDKITREGQWDLMASGSKNGGLGNLLDLGTDPPHMSSYTKEFLRWLGYDTKPKSAFGTYHIKALAHQNIGDKILRYNLEDNDADSTQRYYILEARNESIATWDTSVPSTSLVLYYVDTLGYDEYGYNTPSGIMSNQCRTINIPAGGVLSPNAGEYFDPHNLLVMRTHGVVTDSPYTIRASLNELSSLELLVRRRAIILNPTATFQRSTCPLTAAITAPVVNMSSTSPHLSNTEFLLPKLLRATTPPSVWPTYFVILQVIGGGVLLGLIGWLFVKLQSARHPIVAANPKRKKALLLAVAFLLIFSSLILPRILVLFLSPWYLSWFPESNWGGWGWTAVSAASPVLWLLSWVFDARKSGFGNKIRKVVVYFWLGIAALITVLLVVILAGGGFSGFGKDQTDFARYTSAAAVTSPPTEAVSLPDLDLHLFTDSGQHIGMNYTTGEYEVSIPEVLVSGDLNNAPEWILVPETVTNFRFAVVARDNQQFLAENPGIAVQLADVSDSYDIYARYFDPDLGIFTSATISDQVVEPHETIIHTISGTTDIAVSEGALEVEIDIKPDSDPNTINCRNPRGVIPIAVLTTDTFDATTVDPENMRFGPGGAQEIHRDREGRAMRHIEDADGDGDNDLLLHFNFGASAIQCGDIEATLTGTVFDGRNIAGFDAIRTVTDGRASILRESRKEWLFFGSMLVVALGGGAIALYLFRRRRNIDVS